MTEADESSNCKVLAVEGGLHGCAAVAVLRGLALFLEQLATQLAGWADRVAAFIEQLDAEWPAWRELEMAQG